MREVHKTKLSYLLDELPFTTAGEVLDLCPGAGESSRS